MSREKAKDLALFHLTYKHSFFLKLTSVKLDLMRKYYFKELSVYVE